MENSQVNIYEYNDYRQFLKDFQEAQVKVDAKFTKSFICKKMGMPNTRSYFGDILRGRPLTSPLATRLAQVFKLDNEKTEYFKALVQYGQCTEPQEKVFLFENLITLNKAPKTILNKDAFQYYTKWYHAAIRAVLDVYDFSGKYNELVKRIDPPITTQQARESISLLKKLKLIKKNEDGFFKPTDEILSTGQVEKDELIRQLHLESLNLIINKLSSSEDKDRNTYTNTVSLSNSAYAKLLKEFQVFKERVRTIVHKDREHAEKVLQIGMQIFSLTR